MHTFPNIRQVTSRCLVALLVWVVPGLAGATCPEPTTLSALQDTLGRAERALTELDITRFKEEVEAAESILPCLADTLPPPVVAEYHRYWGIRAFGERDPLARRAFAAARYLEPRYRFSESLIPSGNPILAEYTAVDVESRAVLSVPPPAEGRLLFDGKESQERPSDWPVIVQHIDSRGVQFTAHLRPDTPMPAYPVRVAQVLGPGPEDPQGVPMDLRRPLMVGTGSAALVTGILYGLALRGKARFKDVERNPVPDEDLPGLRSRTNGLVVASAITGSLAIGGGVTLALTW